VNRPNRPPTANRSVVVQVQRGVVREKAGKLPEWATATAVITGISIYAFAASSFYVYALARTLDKPLAIYFSPADYLRITPLWAIPTLGSAALFGTICILLGFVYRKEWATSISGEKSVRLLSGVLSATSLISAILVTIFLPDNRLRLILLVILVSLFLLAGLAWAVTYISSISGEKLSSISGEKLVRFLSVAIFAISLISSNLVNIFLPDNKLRSILLVILVSLFFLAGLSWAVTHIPVSTGVRLLLATVPWSMYFALFLGEYHVRFDIEEAPLTRVLFESEKDRLAAVQGKIIFDLERYLLLLSESKSVVAIPHEKIKSIEAPPLPKEQEKLIGGD
jgi:hypothetical protein